VLFRRAAFCNLALCRLEQASVVDADCSLSSYPDDEFLVSLREPSAFRVTKEQPAHDFA
jgi:hypothetical protein